MEKSSILVIALLVLIFLGIMHSTVYQPTTTTTSKTVVVKTQPQQPQKYGYKPPPAYNPYKAQYY
jgi:hypothetical protein